MAHGKESSISEGTFKRLGYDLKNYIIPTLGSIKLCDISYDHAVHLRKKCWLKGWLNRLSKIVK